MAGYDPTWGQDWTPARDALEETGEDLPAEIVEESLRAVHRYYSDPENMDRLRGAFKDWVREINHGSEDPGMDPNSGVQ